MPEFGNSPALLREKAAQVSAEVVPEAENRNVRLFSKKYAFTENLIGRAKEAVHNELAFAKSARPNFTQIGDEFIGCAGK